jgi:SAM-dependent methyltransferase
MDTRTSHRPHIPGRRVHSDRDWMNSYPYLDTLTKAIIAAARITTGEIVCDLGGGDARYVRHISRHTGRQPVVVDAVRFDDEAILAPARIVDDADTYAARPGFRFDVVLIKEALHHFNRPAQVLHDLRRHRLEHGGRIVVVQRPASPQYPLWDGARVPDDTATIGRRHVEHVEAAFRDAELVDVATTRFQFPVSLVRDDYLGYLRRRQLDELAAFDDTELAAGIAELERTLPDDVLTFTDEFEIIVGGRPRPAANRGKRVDL